MRKTKIRRLPREDFKNPRIEDHRTEDQGFKPECEDQSAKIEELWEMKCSLFVTISQKYGNPMYVNLIPLIVSGKMWGFSSFAGVWTKWCWEKDTYYVFIKGALWCWR